MAGSKPPPQALRGTQSYSEKRDTTLAEAFKPNPLFSCLHFPFILPMLAVEILFNGYFFPNKSTRNKTFD